MNPRLLQAKYELHADESIDIVQIPLAPNTPFPFLVSVQCWLLDQGSTRQFLSLESDMLIDGAILIRQPGDLAISAGASGGFVPKALDWPQEDFEDTLLMSIAQHSKPREFGIYYRGQTPLIRAL